MPGAVAFMHTRSKVLSGIYEWQWLVPLDACEGNVRTLPHKTAEPANEACQMTMDRGRHAALLSVSSWIE